MRLESNRSVNNSYCARSFFLLLFKGGSNDFFWILCRQVWSWKPHIPWQLLTWLSASLCVLLEECVSHRKWTRLKLRGRLELGSPATCEAWCLLRGHLWRTRLSRSSAFNSRWVISAGCTSNVICVQKKTNNRDVANVGLSFCFMNPSSSFYKSNVSFHNFFFMRPLTCFHRSHSR